MLKVLPMLVLLPGFALLLYATIVLVRDVRAKGWPTVQGQLKKMKVDSSARGVEHRVISYEYEVDGRHYVGNRYSFGYLAGGISGGGEIYAKIKRDLQNRPTVTVFYDPSNPRESLLVPGAAWIHAINYFVAGIFLAVTLGLLLRFWSAFG